MSIAGTDLQPVGQQLLAQAAAAPDDANLLMNLSIATLCLGQRALGLALQQQALALQRRYHRAATVQPATLRLLVLATPGDLAANAPIDCLLERADVDLDWYYLEAEAPLQWPDPLHDAVLVAVSDSEQNRPLLRMLERALANAPMPVINRPQCIPAVGRVAASEILQGVPGLAMPPTLNCTRAELDRIASGAVPLASCFPGLAFPLIVRPADSQGGRDLEQVQGPQQLQRYLGLVPGEDFCLSMYVDYRSQDGLFRKLRVALVDGQPFICHLAISSHWMVHYINAGMYAQAWKREEEAGFMQDFAAFAATHQAALSAVWQRTGLDYLCIDCAQTADGRLLIFEIDHTSVVHAMDPELQFPHKQHHIRKVSDAFCALLRRRIAGFV